MCFNKFPVSHNIILTHLFYFRMDDGVDLGRLIDETRKLAAENAQFCEIHTNLNREIKRLKDEKLNLTQTNGSLSKKVKHLQAKLDGGDDIVSQMKVS